jgi:hypothetical protein
MGCILTALLFVPYIDHTWKLLNPIRTNDYSITSDKNQTNYHNDNELKKNY